MRVEHVENQDMGDPTAGTWVVLVLPREQHEDVLLPIGWTMIRLMPTRLCVGKMWTSVETPVHTFSFI